MPSPKATESRWPRLSASYSIAATPGETAHRRSIGVGHDGGAALWADASWAFPVARLDGTPKTRGDWSTSADHRTRVIRRHSRTDKPTSRAPPSKHQFPSDGKLTKG